MPFHRTLDVISWLFPSCSRKDLSKVRRWTHTISICPTGTHINAQYSIGPMLMKKKLLQQTLLGNGKDKLQDSAQSSDKTVPLRWLRQVYDWPWKILVKNLKPSGHADTLSILGKRASELTRSSAEPHNRVLSEFKAKFRRAIITSAGANS